ncbi:Carboxylesterase A [Streptomyces sp. RB5]|uniref:Carboxylesterase A n=1 Tax=Streptomyces smaragdinus TaxID=2585196 RepID=A0A7K0CSE9_9ACTN|nr:alpha/beta hydrolase [Streptomyces smaragdinus]MQY16283.1 Carboxylesterase A [Streptomyces smaragdinus]
MSIRTAAAALALLLPLSAAACSSPSEEPAPPPARKGGEPTLPATLTAQSPDWKSCGAPVGAPPGQQHPPKRLADGTRWECATLTVPVDYAKPGGETMGIALIRARAKSGADRIGSLVFNFGGPGASGVRGLANSAQLFENLRERYDLVGFDPRGVAASSRVRCLPDKRLDAFFAMDATPDSAAEEKTYLDSSRAFNEACDANAGPLLPHIGTADAARDMDLMRTVLGDDKLNYFGFSYGTKLGGVYAHLFPKHVGRMTIDAVVDPTADLKHHALNQATGFQRALNNYFRSRGEDPKAGTARITALLKRLDTHPLPTRGGRPLTENQALTGIVVPLYDKAGWPTLTQALTEAEQRGTGTILLALADQYNGREASGKYGLQAHAQRAVDCADSSSRPTLAEAKGWVTEFTAISPVFGPFLAWDTAGWCVDWPVEGASADPDVSAPGAPAIVVVGGKGDPATPYEGARRMVDELGPGTGILVTYEGEGHGAYGTGDTCVTEAVDAYFLRGKTPSPGTTCG